MTELVYTPESWNDLYVMFGGAAAALAGLIFVAVSLNDEAVLQARALPALVLRTLSTLIGIIVLCGAGLIPGQDPFFLGLEVLIVGVALTGISFVTTVRNFSSTTYVSRRIVLLLLAAAASLPAVIGGISILAGVGGGQYWLAFGFAAGTIVASYHAWILLIVIRR